MTPYLILAWDDQTSEADALAQRLRADLRASRSDWTLLLDKPGKLIAVSGNGVAASAPVQGMDAFVIGDVFPHCDGHKPVARLLASVSSFEDLCRQLVDAYWGAYVAVQVGNGGDISLFRDPIGMRDGIGWTACGVQIFSSGDTSWLGCAAPADFGIDWQRVAQLLLDSGSLAESTPLTGIATLPPGTLIDVRQGRQNTRRLWSPGNFYDRSARWGSTKQGTGRQSSDRLGMDGYLADPDRLKETITACVRAWTERYPNNMLEISGGFDSAVVAAAGTSIRRGINFYTAQLSGDERRFARAVSDARHIPLDEIFMPLAALSEAMLEELPIGARPGLGSATLFHDRLLAEAASKHRIETLFTGHGGDSVFFQHPTAMIAADPSYPRWDFRTHAALARWSRESIWTVAGYAFHVPGWRETRRIADDALATLPIRNDIMASPSSWAGEMTGLPPAKCIQLAGMASDRGVIGPCWRNRTMTVVHPLLSQPLVEYAIATDAFVLTEGRRDRALARKAFAPMLPASVIQRKGKGRLASYFGQCLAASVPFLRAFLLDGLLVRHSILDRAKLEPMLDIDYLMRFDCYVKLRSALVMEQWVRVWQSRIENAPSVRSPGFAVLPERHRAR